MPKKTMKKPISTRKQKIAISRTGQSTSGVLKSTPSVAAFEYLENPVKSQTDENEYRVIKLSNGFTATLILRPGVVTAEEYAPKVNKPNDCNGTERDENEDFEWYRTMMSQKKTIFPETSCKLCINVGSFSDPPHVPATSQLLSRTVCTGSKKHPQDDDFTQFITANGGFRISYERCENTTLYFQITDKFLRRAMERFAQCFVAPLIKRSSIINGKNEIFAEFYDNLQSTELPDRKEHLFGSIGSPGSPVRVFGEFYVEPLCQISNDEVYREVLKFREDHYTADRMSLVIESRLPLDTLEDYVKEYFSKIPRSVSQAKSPNPFNFDNCFSASEFRMIYEMKPVFGDINAKVLELTWSIPPRQKYYRCKPEKYIAWLIRRKCDGSLFSYLRKKKWCSNLYSRVDDYPSFDNSIYSLFVISLIVTDDGYDNRKNIIDAFYSYMNLLRREGPQKRIYDEIRNIEEAKFRFTKATNSPGAFDDLCENMFIYPSKDYLAGGILCFEYDSALIEKLTNFLIPERGNIIVFDQNFDGIDRFAEGFPRDEENINHRTYHARYEISDDDIEYWKIVEPFPEFDLPKANAYVADDFSLISVNEDLTRFPIKIHEDDLTEIWYMGDEKFRLPECHMIYHYVNPLAWSTCENAAMLDLFVTSLKNSLLEQLHSANIAGLEYDICSSERGLEVRINGFSQKLPLLMETINERMAEFSNLVAKYSFEEMKEEQLELYLDHFSNAKKLAEDVRLSILCPAHWTWIDRRAIIIGLKVEKFQHFVAQFLGRVNLQCLVQGNIERSAVIENVRKCVEILKFKPISSRNVTSFKMLKIPRSPRCCRVQGFEDDDWVQNYYQFDDSSLKTSVMIDLLIIIMNNPLCKDLDTLEELNHWEFNPSKQSRGYSLAVRPYRRNINNEIVWGDASIEKFRKLLNKTLKDLSENNWQCVKKVLTRFKEDTAKTMREEVEQNWREIFTGEYIFDRRERELRAVDDLGIRELKEFMSILTMGGPNLRKLSVQVVGKNISEPAQNNENTPQYRLEYLTALPVLGERKSDYYMTDAEAYKRDLRVFSHEDKIAEGMEKDCQISPKQ